MPVANTTLGTEPPPSNSKRLGHGRDPPAPIREVATVGGEVVVPLDAGAFGFRLKAAVGAPTAKDTGPLDARIPVRRPDAAEPLHRDRHAGDAAPCRVFGLRA